jgi:hypothetical protein
MIRRSTLVLSNAGLSGRITGNHPEGTELPFIQARAEDITGAQLAKLLTS